MMELVQPGELRKAQEEDPTALQIITMVQKNSTLLPKQWSLRGEILYHQDRIYVPLNNELRRRIVQQIHDSPSLGHPGVFRTQALLQRQYWWPRMGHFIAKYVQGCALCQQMKINTHLGIKIGVQPKEGESEVTSKKAQLWRA